MTTDLLDRPAVSGGFAAAYRENVIPDLASWSSKGERCALVTLVGVDGNSPRAEGAQMAVSETGQWSGYISGGCLEAAIALEAVAAIKAGKPRLLRYGKGSPYLDIRLPCGSGLDVFIQPMRDAALIEDMSERLERREPFALRIDLATGACQLQARAGSPLQSLPRGEQLLSGLRARAALSDHRLKPDRRGACGTGRFFGLRGGVLRHRSGYSAEASGVREGAAS